MKSRQLSRVFFWNRNPGEFVNKNTGAKISVMLSGVPVGVGPQFLGSVQEWYETLVETVIDMRNHLEKDAGCKADRVTVWADSGVFHMLTASVLFHPSPDDRGSGTISQMRIMEDREAVRFQMTVEIEYKLSGRTRSVTGHVHVLED